MATRHKRIVATLDTGAAADWNDDHISDFTDEITHECMLIGPAVTNCYDTAQTSGGSAPVATFEDDHGWIKFSTGATTNQTSCMRHKFNAAAGNITYINDYPILTMAINLNAFHTAGTVFEFGLMASATNPFTANQDGAYFRVKDNKLYAVTGTGAAETETELTDITLSQDIYMHVRIELNATGANFYVDDMETYEERLTTNLPDNDLTIKIHAISVNNVDTILRTDGIGLTILRVK